jgi:hypothetical protein
VESSHQAVDPPRIDKDIIIGVRDVRAPRLRKTLVPRAGEADMRLRDVAEPLINRADVVHDPSAAVVDGRAVDDDHFDLWIGEQAQARETLGQRLAPVARADDDGHELVRDDTAGACPTRRWRPCEL